MTFTPEDLQTMLRMALLAIAFSLSRAESDRAAAIAELRRRNTLFDRHSF